MTYETRFNLTAPVIDYDAASEYLVEDDMTKYLKNDDRVLGRDKVAHIEWELWTEYYGYITVETYGALTPEESRSISEWIRGQCSDGLGEGFEQRDFACYPEDEEDGYSEWIMASFDWEINDYPLRVVD